MARVRARSLPKIDQVLRAIGKTPVPRGLATTTARRELAALRLAGKSASLKQVVTSVRNTLRHLGRAGKKPVINGTGLVAPPGSSAGPARRPTSQARLAASRIELRRRAEKLKLAVEAMPMKTSIGFGKLPGERGGSRSAGSPVTLEMLPLNLTLQQFASRLQKGTPPVIGYVADGRFKMDLRTVDSGQDEQLFRAVFKAFGL